MNATINLKRQHNKVKLHIYAYTVGCCLLIYAGSCFRHEGIRDRKNGTGHNHCYRRCRCVWSPRHC